MSAAKNLSHTIEKQEITNLLDSLEFEHGNIELFFQTLTHALTDFFQVDKASIWLFNDEPFSISCRDQYDRNTQKHTSGETLKTADYVIYFKSLNDWSDTPIALKNIIDVQLKINDQCLGVLCLEQVEAKKTWKASDYSLLKIASHSVAKSLHSKERIKSLESLLKEERAKPTHPTQMAHEINNPLTIILGNAYLLNSLAEENNQNVELQKTAISKIVDAANRIDKIIREIKSTK